MCRPELVFSGRSNVKASVPGPCDPSSHMNKTSKTPRHARSGLQPLVSVIQLSFPTTSFLCPQTRVSRYNGSLEHRHPLHTPNQRVTESCKQGMGFGTWEEIALLLRSSLLRYQTAVLLCRQMRWASMKVLHFLSDGTPLKKTEQIYWSKGGFHLYYFF